MNLRALAPLLALTCLAAAACTSSKPGSLEEARKANQEFALKQAGPISAKHGAKFVVVENAEVVAAGSLADDAVRAASQFEARTGRRGPHRFVFRTSDRGPRLYRTTYLAAGGVAAGRKLFQDLGFQVAGGAGRALVLDAGARRRTLDAAREPILEIEVSALDGSGKQTLRVPVDPDFDGGLLVSRDLAPGLATERAEIPGDAEVQVALGRPFDARRAFVWVRVPSLGVAGPVEALVPTK